jgi:UDP-N-acetylmuramoyl-L-alanyl-D-glutamate--2,6-diaminopimelate ligase
MALRTILKKIIPQKLFSNLEPTGHLIEAVASQVAYGFPARKLKVIGVTGTDGKTTTSTIITQMLRHAGYSVAMVTTISVDYGDGKGERPNPSRMTTMGAASLMKILKRVASNDVEWLVLETTSHALAQHRVWGIPYYIAVWTNLGHEHLDYHKTFERYRDAKRMLFKQADACKKGLRIGIINADDPSAKYFIKDIETPITYGIHSGELRAENVKVKATGSTYTAVMGDSDYKIECHLPGTFNVYNSLAAIGVGRAIGLDSVDIEQGIASIESVEGRMTRVDEGQDFEVIVDYAHTPESFEKLFQEIKPLTKGRLITVFGSAGRRDEKKRSVQGATAGKYCDIVIVTEEDDRDADGEAILKDIASGAHAEGKTIDKDLFLIHKREHAVEKAIGIARAGDVILLLGKGHEKSILTNGPEAAKKRHELQNDNDPKRVIKRQYDEVSVARAILKKKG